MATNENLPPNVIKQLVKELKNLDECPPEGIKVLVNGDDFSTIFADIDGPVGTPYENGVFRIKLSLSHDFPQSPPKGFFLTKIFHPNIATNGEICVNTLKKDWNPCVGLRHVLLVIRCLLIEPFPESALNEQAGKMLLENYEEYARHARLFTGIHAVKAKPKFKALTISESTAALNVDQKPFTCNAGEPPLPLNSLSTASPSRATHDHGAVANPPATPTELNVPPSAGQATIESSTGTAAYAAAQKRGTAGAAKVLADRKKMDARKKSLKRL